MFCVCYLCLNNAVKMNYIKIKNLNLYNLNFVSCLSRNTLPGARSPTPLFVIVAPVFVI